MLCLALMMTGVAGVAGCAGPPPPPAAKVAAAPPPLLPPPLPVVRRERPIPLPARKPVPPPEPGSPAPEDEAVAMAAPPVPPSGSPPVPPSGSPPVPPSGSPPAPPSGSPPPYPPRSRGLIGLDQKAAVRLFGTAAEKTEKPPATVWRWRSGTCELDLYFYLDLRSGQMRSLHYVFKDDATGQQDCLKSLAVAARG